ncbi:MAG: ATP-binding cassette domain-containing protein [Chloroflexota bacterium]
MSLASRRTITAERLHDLGLAHIDLDARPRELSVGQCQRVAIARVLVAQPALDASVSAAILHLLADVANTGTAIVMVSHDQAILHALCHRVLAMRDGILEGSQHT